jgi:hypothetical protein
LLHRRSTVARHGTQQLRQGVGVERRYEVGNVVRLSSWRRREGVWSGLRELLVVAVCRCWRLDRLRMGLLGIVDEHGSCYKVEIGVF